LRPTVNSFTPMSDSNATSAMEAAPRLLLIAYKIREGAGSEDGSGYHIAAELVRRGCDITLISRENNVELLRDDPNFKEVTLVGVDVPKALGFFKRGGRGIILYYYIWQVVVGRRALGIARETRFDIVHQLNFHTDWAPHFLWRLDRPVVWGPIAHHRFTPRSFFPSGDRLGFAREIVRAAVKRAFWYLDPFLRIAVRRTPTIIYANEDFAPPFRRHASRIVVRPYAGSFAQQEDDTAPPEEMFRALWIGRFVPLKGLVPAIEAFARFDRVVLPQTPTELVLVGAGPLEDYALHLAVKFGVADRVRVLAWLPQEELSGLYASSSVFLYPSVEAQGLVVAEALAFGLPVLAIRGTGPALLTGPAGWTVDGGNVVAGLADALAEAYRCWHSERLTKMRRAATERYRSRLDWPRIVDDILTAYGKASDGGSAK
jgi:glycosyltransferase involved in cell wall biosynthesis